MSSRVGRHGSLAIVAAALIMSTMAAGPVHAAPVPDLPAGPGLVIVDVTAGTTPESVAAKYGIVPTQIYTEVISGFAATVDQRQLSALRVDQAVESITSDGVVSRRDPREGRRSPGPPPQTVPEQFEQYVTPEIRRIGGLSSKTADIDGLDDRRVDAGIAILDGGIDPYHPDLNVVGGYDCVAGPKAQRGYYDRGDGHGTVVAALAAAIDNGIGIVGAAPGARLYAIRVADPFGSITDSALLCGLEWVIRHADRVDVANLSLAGSGNMIGPCLDHRRLGRDRYGKRVAVDRVHQKICRATARGVTVVAAAGNDAQDASAYTPAAYEEVITVSAFADFDGKPGGDYPGIPEECLPFEADDEFATFSNFGRPIDISAPGVCAFSIGPGGSSGYVEGTSFSAPLVAGAAALIKAKNPSLAPARVRARLLALAEPGPIAGDPDSYPEGVVHIAKL